mmetsp:Transcript_85606/g.195170  ORF Transcript_85606/g.195170 Transcript_85606/m.195170 type:complete len:84 (+) Transcript_85606:46-297(+)
MVLCRQATLWRQIVALFAVHVDRAAPRAWFRAWDGDRGFVRYVGPLRAEDVSWQGMGSWWSCVLGGGAPGSARALSTSESLWR